VRRLGRSEEGAVLVIAVVAMAVMISIGLATLAFGHGQRQLAAGERTRESTFNVTEGVLNSQLFLLSKSWPAASTSAYPASCSSATTATNCPDASTISAQFSGTQYSGMSWTSAVQDNGGSVATYYTTTGATGQPAYDANHDGKLWVRARGSLGGVSRTLVTQVQGQLTSIPFPKNTMTAGYVTVGSSGKKVLVDTNGRSYTSTPGQAGAVAVRCATPPPSSTCLDLDPAKGQFSPPSYQNSYSSTTIVSSDQLAQMKATAQSYGTYTASGCPASLTGTLVYIENGNCSYSSGTFNSLAAPGAVVIATGTLTLSGSATYNGLVYGRNTQATTGIVVTVTGCAKIVGSIAIEGSGGMAVGNCGNNVAYNSSVVSLLQAYGDPAVVKSTWREVTG
jgi:hypothetical protein